MIEILIPTYNREDLLELNLKSLKQICFSRTQITVIDNKSPNPKWERIRSCAPRNMRIVVNYANFTSNINFIRAMAISKSDYRHLIGDDDKLLDSYADIPRLIDNYKPDIIAFDPNAKSNSLCSLKDYIIKSVRDPLLFNNLWHITTFIYGKNLFDMTWALRHVNSLYPHAWALLGPIYEDSAQYHKSCLVLPQAEYIQVSHFTTGQGRSRPLVDKSEGWSQSYLEKAFQCSLFTLWCKTFLLLVDNSFEVEYLRQKYCTRIASVFPEAKNYLLSIIEYNESWN